MHGENPSSRAKQSRPALLTCSNIAMENACFLGNQTGSLCHRNGEGGGERGRGGGVEWRYDTHTDLHLTSRWTCSFPRAFLEEKMWLFILGKTKTSSFTWVTDPTVKCLFFNVKATTSFRHRHNVSDQNSIQLHKVKKTSKWWRQAWGRTFAQAVIIPCWQTVLVLPKCFPACRHLFFYCPKWQSVVPVKVKRGEAEKVK